VRSIAGPLVLVDLVRRDDVVLRGASYGSPPTRYALSKPTRRGSTGNNSSTTTI